METPRKTCNASPEQKKLMLEFIKKHPKVITGKFSNDFTQKNAQNMWQELANLLNSCPGAHKDWKAWRKTWQDIRSRTKTKRSKYLNERDATGGGPYQNDPITTYDSEILDIIKTVSIEGHTNIQESSTSFSFEEPDDKFSLYENKNISKINVNKNMETSPIKQCKTKEKDDMKENEKTTNIEASSENNLPSGKSFPRAPRKKLIYASEASENYRKSLEKKNVIKSQYYEVKLALLERVASAKERLATAKERNAVSKEKWASAQQEIATHMATLANAMNEIQEAIL